MSTGQAVSHQPQLVHDQIVSSATTDPGMIGSSSFFPAKSCAETSVENGV